MAVTAAEVSKLRKATGAGMMDCKNALEENNGDIDAAIEYIRKKGQAVANKRADREATEGAVIALASDDGKKGVIITLNCETDFVAKNDDFVNLAKSIAKVAVENEPANLDELKALQLNGKTIDETITEQIGIIGEKVEVSFYEKQNAGQVIPYIHPGNKLACLVGLSKTASDYQTGKDLAMQVAAMNPVAVDENGVPENVKQKEFDIGKEQARQEGKPENILEKIAEGKLKKFYKDSTLLNQQFIKDQKITVKQYLDQADKGIEVTGFSRYSLNN
jgi:elongation factor Ts